MALQYSLRKRDNLLHPEQPAKVYACYQTRRKISSNQFIGNIARDTALTKSEVYRILLCLLQELKKHMLAGNCVEWMDFGKFRYHISSSGAPSQDAFNTDFIKEVKVHFTPDPDFIPAKKDLEFERVLPVRIKNNKRKRKK